MKIALIILGGVFIILIIVLFVLSPDNIEPNAENVENYVVFSKDDGYPSISKEFVRYTPSSKDARKGIEILNNNLKNNENLLDLEEYKIQIFGYLNENGKKHLWANYFCRNSSKDWQEKQVMVLDGGNCYFNAKVNLDSGKVFGLQIHGDA